MARDEALFTLYPQKNIPTLRVYQWESPCVSLGYFQKENQVLDLEFMSEHKIPFVRRITGGAAILHHQEITYSLCLCCDDLDLSGSVKQSFKKLTSFLLEFYRSLGLEALYASDVPGHVSRPFCDLCFSTNEDFDIMVEGKKLGGNAQKRKKKYIFQHGSIPLSFDLELLKKTIKNVPPDIKEKTHALNDLIPGKYTVKELISLLVNSFLADFGLEKAEIPFSEKESIWMEKLLTTKYTLDSWNFTHGKTGLAE